MIGSGATYVDTTRKKIFFLIIMANLIFQQETNIKYAFILFSAVQLIPAIQKMTQHLYSYQRTPAWVTVRSTYIF